MLQEMALLYHSFTIESSRVQPVICMSNKHDIWSTDDKEIFVLLRTELVPAQFEERKNGNSVYTDMSQRCPIGNPDQDPMRVRTFRLSRSR